MVWLIQKPLSDEKEYQRFHFCEIVFGIFNAQCFLVLHFRSIRCSLFEISSY